MEINDREVPFGNKNMEIQARNSEQFLSLCGLS
jgi:hypothetical protein